MLYIGIGYIIFLVATLSAFRIVKLIARILGVRLARFSTIVAFIVMAVGLVIAGYVILRWSPSPGWGWWQIAGIALGVYIFLANVTEIVIFLIFLISGEREDWWFITERRLKRAERTWSLFFGRGVTVERRIGWWCKRLLRSEMVDLRQRAAWPLSGMATEGRRAGREPRCPRSSIGSSK